MDALFAGFAGTILGAVITVLLTYRVQKRLLEQQLSFLRSQAELDAQLRQQIHKEQLEIFREFRDMVNTRFALLPNEIRHQIYARAAQQYPDTESKKI